ncbi:hypothetical protein [Methylorubrum sp. SB2]|uniref:hypothetical protein n=1 Tax=Methylorubrum subtropicum TaxID=3138812 RepID=UPI00313D143C
MSPHPAFQRGVGYGDRFDAEISDGLAQGLNLKQIAAHIGIGAWFVGQRARVLGYRRPEKAPRLRPIQSAYTPSRLARAMRQRLFLLDRDGLDPSHGVACLHLAGLTLPEIEGATGFPASAVIAAVRQHCAPLGATGADR